jgi:putative NIF3 family GTP cyclohydrolase 1 type 2
MSNAIGGQKLKRRTMKATDLYEQLESDFIGPELSDDWAVHMGSVAGFLTENFKQRSMGLVCDFTSEVKKVYTAVFPSDKVLQTILSNGDSENTMLFVHHPETWDITKAPDIFANMNPELLQKFKDRRISIFNLHVPLDNFGEYSTSVSLANMFGLQNLKPFAPYFGALCGVVGQTDITLVGDLKEKYEQIVGHKISLYDYGQTEIKNQIVAVVAGGGNNPDIIQEAIDLGVNTFVTGISAKNSHSAPAHELAQQNGVNILGGTHYSTEKFACMAMTKYFEKLGLPSEFIEDAPGLADL